MDIRDLKAAGDHALSGIYIITNLINFKIYVGSSVHISNRIKAHKKKLKLGEHPNKHLQSAYNQLGFGSFSFDSIEFCSKENLLEREAYWIKLTDCTKPELGYNKRKIPNSNLGLKFSEETKKKQSLSGLGKHSSKRAPLTNEMKLRLSLANKGLKRSKTWVDRNTARLSKPDKWPHGYKCKCKPCMKLKSQAIRAKQIANAQKEIDCGH